MYMLSTPCSVAAMSAKRMLEERAGTADGARAEPLEDMACAGCGKTLPGTEFSRNQLQKGRGGKPARCKLCVDALQS